MANVLQPKYKETLLAPLLSSVVKVVLVDLGAYTYNSAHQFLSEVAAGARIATSPALSGKSVTNGVFDASDVTLPAVAGASVEALWLIIDTGNAATSPLIAFYDTGVAGLPYTPSGVDVNLVWDNGSPKILAL